MTAPLHGLKILVTRPAAQAQNLCAQITALGGKAILFPTIEIVPIADQSQVQEQLAQLAAQDLAIFVSPNAVLETCKLLQTLNLNWPANLPVAAVGASTAAMLANKNIVVTDCPENFNSESLLALSALTGVKHKKIMLFCGEGGRDLIASTLRARGAQVTEVVLYQRRIPKIAPKSFPSLAEIDIIVCTSNTGLQNLLEIFSVVGRSRLQNMSLLVISERMAEQAQALGFVKTPVVADNATDMGIIKALLSGRRKDMENIEHNKGTESVMVRPKPSAQGTGLATLALIIALITGSALAYLYEKNFTTLSEANNNTAELQSQVQQLKENFAALQAQNERHLSAIKNLQQLSNGDAAAWHFAEAKYLVQLAYYQLSFARDVPASLALLQTAEQRIASINDPTLTPLRQLVANNIAALQAVPKLDLAGLLTRITALQTQTNQLPAIGLPRAKPASQDTDEATSKTPLRKAIHDSWETLQKVVIVRRQDQEIQPLLSPEQQTYLQQNIQLILQQAQWAALRGRADVYQASLEQAKTWVSRYFASNLPATQAFITALNELQKVVVQPPLPDLAPLARTIQQKNLDSETK